MSAPRAASEIVSNLCTALPTDILDVERLLKWFVVVLPALHANCSLIALTTGNGIPVQVPGKL